MNLFRKLVRMISGSPKRRKRIVRKSEDYYIIRDNKWVKVKFKTKKNKS